ncbi:hypothetical protein R1sor_019498 [Riccia sorocarpa]|uniref:GDSL esterase/lipase n=1 Tax=Riccia sorocarpa TaxID=122646 RepID=A0ABD3IDS4_9MARC
MGKGMKSSRVLELLLVSSLCMICSGFIPCTNAYSEDPNDDDINYTESWRLNSSSSPPPYQSSPPCFPGMFIFGDSLADAGNSLSIFPEKFARRQEEMDFNQTDSASFARRFDDGILFGDYLAWAMGLSPVEISPYLQGVGSVFAQGANFAAGGSTVQQHLGASEVLDRHAVFPNLPFTLQQQLEWYRHFKHGAAQASPNINHTATVRAVLPPSDFNSSLHVVFAGYTDYVAPLLSGTPKQEVSSSVTDVVTGISDFVEVRDWTGARSVRFSLTLLSVHGVANILLVNIPPLGCTPGILTLFPGTEDDYDVYGCLTPFNAIARRHNDQLFRLVIELQVKYPLATLSYGDYYQVAHNVLRRPALHGFEVSCPHDLLTACCGAGGAYNFDLKVTCGVPGSANGTLYDGNSCSNSVDHLFWDGFHPSSGVSRYAARSFMEGTEIYPPKSLVQNGCLPDYSQFY